ncbi:NADH-quinone oxidoreductase subunit NuoK [Hydrogenivirga sp. 128-5-R1-1]|uniref:NADH-quinone oxidoreductase subunit NuoK n=1 Tax=Hydrogenivirga sp. 128-5-R1-1 TaxID=392423 RepID=UPI00015F3783|nr:NADH-quinone oxidoreductase subunit NuoK [Hydrogenivirga sp. 128-5-R1-1]EDP76503.1 NADH dehydrogenase I chain K [Hydrogenivirga sp. 128-5-R1-1]
MTIEKAYILLSILIFLIGLFGVIVRKNLITILVSTEIMLNGVNLTLVTVDKYLGKVDGQIFSLFILTVAAAEVAVGLGLVISIFRLKGYEGSSETVHLRD